MKSCARKTGLLLLSLSLLLVFGLTGCLVPINEIEVTPAELVPIDKIELTPAELVRKVVEALQGIETFQSETSTTIHSVSNIAGEQAEMTMTFTTSHVFDLLNARMQMTMTTQVPIPEEARMQEYPEYMEMVVVTYFIDGMIYTRMSMPEMPVVWAKMEMPWEVFPNPICQLVQLLKASEVELRGTEVVRDIDSFVVAVVPDTEKLFEIMIQHKMGKIKRVDPQIMEEGIIDIEDIFRDRDVTITHWICKDTFLPVREHMQITMVMTCENAEAPHLVPEGEAFVVTTTTDTTNYYHSFNEPVSIVLPPEAADAVEMPMP